MTRLRLLTLCLVTLLTSALGGSTQTIIVGSMNSTEQVLLSEIVAQHLERRLGRKVERRPDLGDTRLAYQGLPGGEISLYTEDTGSIVTEILKEMPADDASLIFERAKGEMKRMAQTDLLNPLGIDNSLV